MKLVFIAEECTAEGSDEHKKYVSEWLDDEETICMTKTDFVRMEELFQFNGIPHYETITPDCRRVRDDLRIDGYDNIHAYSGISTSPPSHNTRSVGQEKTKWYQATH